MRIGKKEFILKFLMVITLIGGFSMLPIALFSGFLWPNGISEALLDKIALVWGISWFVPGGLVSVLLPVWGLKQKQDKPQKIILNISNFDDMKTHVTRVLSENQFEIIESGFINECEEYIFFIKDTGINVESFLLTNVKFYCIDQEQIIILKANKIYEERFKNVFSKRAFSGYALVCVDKVDNEFYKYLSTVNESVSRECFYFSGYTFGGKILYLPQYKDSFASKELKKMQHFLENIFRNRTGNNQTVL